jgi:hypothetical protein
MTVREGLALVGVVEFVSVRNATAIFPQHTTHVSVMNTSIAMFFRSFRAHQREVHISAMNVVSRIRNVMHVACNRPLMSTARYSGVYVVDEEGQDIVSSSLLLRYVKRRRQDCKKEIGLRKEVGPRKGCD